MINRTVVARLHWQRMAAQSGIAMVCFPAGSIWATRGKQEPGIVLEIVAAPPAYRLGDGPAVQQLQESVVWRRVLKSKKPPDYMSRRICMSRKLKNEIRTCDLKSA